MPFVQLHNFLSTTDHDRLLTFTLSQQQSFTPTTTSTNAADYRRSLVLHNFPEFSTLIEQRIYAALPPLWQQLDLLPITTNRYESQLTAHNDGNYYKRHNDNGSPDTARRILTYVYYFHRSPKGFSGGELQIEGEAIAPIDNSIIFFSSGIMHEVLPVRCESKSFEDSRFTVNGWLGGSANVG